MANIVVKDKQGLEIEICVSGREPDDLEILEAFYLDDHEKDVPDNVIEHIMEAYADKIYEAWIEDRVAWAEAQSEGDR